MTFATFAPYIIAACLGVPAVALLATFLPEPHPQPEQDDSEGERPGDVDWFVLHTDIV